ncbi:N-acetyltransferase [Streptomyces sp. Ru62]|uniref:GNAT family N-acetyltransferase n=1 Tax=Streptomyces sp. Ru62 TaxID=2080745 RepID=UPI000CDD84A7|nr:GNAT family N-acetyltransferase [Streptomyces sp. Ru62]POX64428.1 N-acetyltransferase [Streptomyces sp. Ru62]
MSYAPAALRPGDHPILTLDGRPTLTRPAVTADRTAVNAMHARCSAESRHRRYQTARQRLTPSEWHSLTGPDRGLAWVTRPVEDPYRVIAATHLLRTPAARTGELAILVEDVWQNVGLGTSLVRHALREAHRLGMASVHVLTDRDNHHMLSICRSLGARVRDAQGPTVDLALPVPEDAS